MDICPKAFCEKCYSNQEYKIKERTTGLSIRGIRFSYPELYAVCRTCGEEVYAAPVSDRNVEARYKAYYAKIESMKED